MQVVMDNLRRELQKVYPNWNKMVSYFVLLFSLPSKPPLPQNVTITEVNVTGLPIGSKITLSVTALVSGNIEGDSVTIDDYTGNSYLTNYLYKKWSSCVTNMPLWLFHSSWTNSRHEFGLNRRVAQCLVENWGGFFIFRRRAPAGRQGRPKTKNKCLWDHLHRSEDCSRIQCDRVRL